MLKVNPSLVSASGASQFLAWCGGIERWAGCNPAKDFLMPTVHAVNPSKHHEINPLLDYCLKRINCLEMTMNYLNVFDENVLILSWNLNCYFSDQSVALFKLTLIIYFTWLPFVYFLTHFSFFTLLVFHYICLSILLSEDFGVF